MGTDFKSGQKVRLNDEDNVPYSPTNPLPVSISASEGGDEIHDYDDNGSTDVLVDNSVNHDYVVTALKELYLEKILFSASGRMRAELQIETAVASGTYDTKAVGFIQAGSQSECIDLKRPIRVAAGVTVRVVKTNMDNDDQCLYSTIIGLER